MPDRAVPPGIRLPLLGKRLQISYSFTPAQKCLLTIATGYPIFLTLAVYLACTMMQPGIENVTRIALMQGLLLLNIGIVLIFSLLTVRLWWQRHDPAPKMASSFTVVILSVIGLVAFGIATGAYTSPAAPSTILALLVGLALQPRYIVVLGFALSVVGLASYGVLSFAGLVPYAPLFVSGTFVDGQPVAWWYNLRQLMLYGGLVESILLVFGLFHWIDYRRSLLEKASRTDHLTAVANRRYFMQRLHNEIQRHHKLDTPVCLALCDADHFKAVNDTYGHHVGDEVLAKIGQLLTQIRRPVDTVARLGGEEFALILPECNRHQAAQVCERLRLLLQDHVFQIDGQSLRVTISIGVVECSQHSVEQLLQAADQHLYAAKAQGRNRVVDSINQPGYA